MPSLTKIAAVAAGLLTFTEAKACPPLGAVLPAPQSPSSSPYIRAANKTLKKTLDAKIASNFNTSGVSIAVKSIHEDDSLFTYSFTPPNPGLGTDEVDLDTVFRIASGSKLFTALAARVNDKIDLNASVLKYLPGLNKTAGDDEILNMRWEDVTVGSLASHLSGVGVDSEFVFQAWLIGTDF